jgi:glutamate carboxypeptidase
MTAHLHTTETLLDGIRRWVEIESPSHDPKAVTIMASQVEREALSLGLSVRSIPLENGAPLLHISNRQPDDTRPGITVIGHLDTVHPVGTLATNPFRIENGKAYGPGIYDMKAGCFLALAAAGAVTAEHSAQLPIDLLFNPDEEISSVYSRRHIEDFARAWSRYVLVAEPARPDGGRCVTQRKGIGRIRLCACGRQAHAGLQHELGRSAIKEMAHQILALESLTDYARGLTVSVGTIKGGTTPNVVPGRCEIEADFRVTNLDTFDTLQRHVSGLQPVDADVQLQTSIDLRRPPMTRIAATQALLDTVQQAGKEVGLNIEEAPMTGGASDANFTAALAIPTIDGLGADGNGAHTLHEHILIDTLAARHAFWCRILSTLH